jgi:GTP-binding protein Era
VSGVSRIETQPESRTGYVAIVGRPNVGKSTLLNALVGEHVSITSRKPQTTRGRVLGVLTRTAAGVAQQFVFVDTPGLQRRRASLLTRRMNETIAATLREVDAVVLVIEARGWTRDDEAMLALLPPPPAGGAGKVVLAINKIDLLAKPETLLPLLQASAARYPFAALVPVSAERSRQLDGLLDELGRLLPAGEPLFDPDQYTDRSERFLAAELIREKAFRLLGDELPYGVAVGIDRWEDDAAAPGRVHIVATLVVDRESHKGIVIGAGGAKLREIGRLARKDIEQMLGRPVMLETHVRVQSGWSERAAALKAFGYE